MGGDLLVARHRRHLPPGRSKEGRGFYFLSFSFLNTMDKRVQHLCSVPLPEGAEAMPHATAIHGMRAKVVHIFEGAWALPDAGVLRANERGNAFQLPSVDVRRETTSGISRS
jgi:hypothetical protein